MRKPEKRKGTYSGLNHGAKHEEEREYQGALWYPGGHPCCRWRLCEHFDSLSRLGNHVEEEKFGEGLILCTLNLVWVQ